jgi:hypothetical protein
VVKALKTLVKELDRPPALAILDTWSRTLGGDDSAPSDAAAGVAALDALRARFENFAALVVHHEGHTKGRGRGWSGLRAAVDAEFRAERGKDDLLRLECTKSKDTRPVDPMAFQFVSTELGITDEEGNPFTSAVLNTVDWTPDTETATKKPVGKNQTLALDILKRLEAEARENRGDDGWVSLTLWRDECKAAGIDKYRMRDVKKSLEENGLIEIYDDLFIKTPLGASGGGRWRGGVLLYNTPPPTATSGGGESSGGTPQNATTPPEVKETESTKTLPAVTVTEKGKNVENTTVSNASNGQPDTISPRAATSEEPELAIW